MLSLSPNVGVLLSVTDWVGERVVKGEVGASFKLLLGILGSHAEV